MSLEHEIQSLFVANHWSLATAESCTGGAIAAKLTKISGASKYFLGSIIAYSNDFKQDLLHVPHKLLEKHGAVSEEVVEAMVQGLLKGTNADFGIAVTGIAGPLGGSPQKPVGTVWISVMHRNSFPITEMLKLTGDRLTIIEGATTASLQLLHKTALGLEVV